MTIGNHIRAKLVYFVRDSIHDSVRNTTGDRVSNYLIAKMFKFVFARVNQSITIKHLN